MDSPIRTGALAQKLRSQTGKEENRVKIQEMRKNGKWWKGERKGGGSWRDAPVSWSLCNPAASFRPGREAPRPPRMPLNTHYSTESTYNLYVIQRLDYFCHQQVISVKEAVSRFIPPFPSPARGAPASAVPLTQRSSASTQPHADDVRGSVHGAMISSGLRNRPEPGRLSA